MKRASPEPPFVQMYIGIGSNAHEECITRCPVSRLVQTRQDSYYHNIASTISWHTVSKKTPVEACEINSITNQILQIISKKQRKRKEKKYV